MNPIFGALAAGYTTKEIINFISQMFPGFAGKISQAVSSGYAPDEIIKYLQKLNKNDFKKIGKRGDKNLNYRLPDEDDKPKTSMQKANEIWYGGKEEFVPEQTQKSSILPALGSAAIGVAGGLAAPVIKNALSRAIPSLSPLLQQQQQAQHMPQQSPETILQNEAQQPPINPVNTSNIAQAQQVTQPKGIVNPKEYLEKLGLKDKVDDLLNRGNSPEQTAIVLGLKGSAKKMGKSEIDPELLENIDAYAKELKVSTSVPEEKVENVPEEESNIVASPQGVGKVITSRNGKSLIEIDGKKHQVDDKSLLKPPKEAAIEALELIKGFTPEEMRSTHHMLNAYDEGENKGFFVFHNGSAYVVDDITPEEYKELSEEVEKAKTTGETIIGKWASGEGSRGAGYNKVVKGVRERKVVPELKKKFRKLKVGYNLLAEWQRLLNEK